jgi:hypothetical protein
MALIASNKPLQIMKKALAIIFLFITSGLFAQDYLLGKLTGESSGSQNIFYDRTQLLLSSKIHQTLYKVMSENKQSIYAIYITHDQEKAVVTIAVTAIGGDTKTRSINYDGQKCGLVFSDAGNIDTVFPNTQNYAYLFSFTDLSRDYPVLHKIKISEGKEMELDPLTKLRVRKHNDLVRKFAPQVQPVADLNVAKSSPAPVKSEETAKDNSLVYSLLNDSFNNQLFAMRDSLYDKNARYIDIITKMKTSIEGDISLYMKSAQVYNDESRYGGQERNGQPDGKGVLVSDGNVYDGNFSGGLFVNGQSILKTKTSVYYGENTRDTMNGMGWLKFNNGSFLLGEFKNGKLLQGISLSKENSEVFFGNLKNNVRTGYGELRNSRGDNFYGEFLNGRLIKGYCKEVDQFGYSTYSRVQNGTKATVPAQLAEIFFDKVHIIKEKAENQ